MFPGRKYVFDIRRTRQEAYDHYRRILHSNNPGIPCSNEAPPGGETRNESEMMICDCDNDNDNEKEIDSDDSVDNFNVSSMAYWVFDYYDYFIVILLLLLLLLLLIIIIIIIIII